MTTVYIDMTNEQLEAIRPVIKIAIEADNAGSPGMVVGQIAGEKIKVGFLPHDIALPLAKKDAAGHIQKITVF